jgi:hypothetical protein
VRLPEIQPHAPATTERVSASAGSSIKQSHTAETDRNHEGDCPPKPTHRISRHRPVHSVKAFPSPNA